MDTADRGPGLSSRLRPFLPLLVCIIAFSALLGWLYHSSRARQARITFSVRVDGVVQSFYTASLNGSAYQSGEPSGLGSKSLRVDVENTEPFQTNVFVRYGGMDLGTIDLRYSQAVLALDVAPGSNKVTIRGERFRKEFRDCTRQILTVPVGDYSVETEFEYFRVERKATVRRNAESKILIQPSIATLAIIADPADAQFQLESKTAYPITIKGTTPTTIRVLPQGQYDLNIWRGNFRKTIPVVLNSEITNTMAVRFDYAKVDFRSNPPGANIKNGDKKLGTTPLAVSFIPGSYRIRIEKDGYVSKDFDFVLQEGDKQKVEVTLPNIAYLEAMDRARSALTQFNVDFGVARREVEKALQIQADDAEALRLRDEILFLQQVASAQELARKNDIEGALKLINLALEKNSTDSSALNLKAELETAKRNAASRAAEERRQRPNKLFSQAIGAIQYKEFFETQTMTVNARAEKVRSGVIRALAAKPIWTIRQNRDMGDGIFIIDAEWKSLIAKQRVVLLVDQTSESSSKVYFRLWDYVLANNVQFTFKEGITDDSWRPLHKDYSSWTPPVVEQQRARSLQAFRQKLEIEFKSP